MSGTVLGSRPTVINKTVLYKELSHQFLEEERDNGQISKQTYNI